MRFRYACCSAFALFAFAAACTSVPETAFAPEIESAAEASAAAATAADRLRADVVWLADDAREGREAGSQGYRDAAEYVAARMALTGLQPGADGRWFQEVPFVTARPVAEAAKLSIAGPDGRTAQLDPEEFRLSPSVAEESFDIDGAEAVFVGYGVHAPQFGHDDYDGVDVKGKIIVAFSGAPDIFDTESAAHFNSNSLKAKVASERGAVGLISVYTSELEEKYPWEDVKAYPVHASTTWVAPDGTPDAAGPGVKFRAVVSPAVAARLFTGAPHSFAEAQAAMSGEGEAVGGFNLPVKISAAGAVNYEKEFTSPNVVGLIPGADPALKDEYVVLTAHLDHVGVNEKLIAEGKDGINNGALDNAVGVATLIEAARQFMNGPAAPARSVMIVALTAEEKGLLGSDYFAHYPPVGGGEVVADVNLDMPVMLYSFTDVVGFGAERSTIGPIMKEALGAAGIALSPDPIPELGVFTRSDHYRFVEQGVPSIFLWPGFANGGEEKFWDFYKTRYHKPGDDTEQPILYEDLARFANVNFIIAKALADAPEKPAWNEGDFFGDTFGK